MIRVSVALAIALAAPWITSGTASAGPHTEVLSGFEQGSRVDWHVTLDYGLEVKRAAVLREAVGFPDTAPDDPIPRIKDLVFEGSRHVLLPRVEVGVFTDVSVSLALPLVLSDARTLKLDQRAQPCVFPGDGAEPTCIDRTTSSTIVDGLLPATGFDARDADGPGFAEGDTIFRGPGRSGVDQLHLGASWAPMNQRRDDTKPTWKVGAELRLAIGQAMRLNPRDPGRWTGVGRGVHELELWTTMAKRVGRVEPYVEIWWRAPFATAGNSAFADLGYGQDRPGAQQRAGTRFGAEALAWSWPERDYRVAVDVSARLEAMFEGRAYSEMWEVFQYAGTLDVGSDDIISGPLVLDRDPVEPGLQPRNHPGVTTVENHLRMGGRVGAQAMLGERIRVGTSFEVVSSQSHTITFADAGVDLPTCEGATTTQCETDANNLIDPGTEEVNPAYVPLVDMVGKRYYVDEVVDYVFLIDARYLF